jgi:hypothetical protein
MSDGLPDKSAAFSRNNDGVSRVIRTRDMHEEVATEERVRADCGRLRGEQVNSQGRLFR